MDFNLEDLEDLEKFLQQIELTNINNIIKNRKIENLIHFTKLENLNSILKMGFLSREYLQSNNIPFKFNDFERRDNKTNATCFSVEYPNEYLLNKFKKIYFGSKWLIIIVNINVLLDQDLEKSFCMRNAGGTPNWLNNSDCHRSDAFNKMFCEDPGSKSDIRSKQYYIKDYLPTDVQAEILIKGNIGVNYIKRIIFESSDDLDLCIENYVENLLLNKYNPIVDERYFKKREDFPWEDR